jgi:class 3 adenylate cyclase
VNLGARLQAHAQPREVVLTADLYALVAAEHPGATPERIEVRGRAEPVEVCVLSV